MEPVIRLGGADTEKLCQHDLERVGLEVNQEEQQFLSRLLQCSLATSPGAPLSGSARREVRIWADKLIIPKGVQLLAGETVTLVITPQGSK